MKFNTAIVVFNNGAFGGAAKRYCNLFLHLNQIYPGKFFLFVNSHLFNQLNVIYPSLPLTQIKIIGRKFDYKNYGDNVPSYHSDITPDPREVDKKHSVLRKVYWFYKNKFLQYKLFSEIESLRKELNLKVFYGVFSGVLPLVFYLNKKPRRSAVIFSDMDSWFSDVHSDMKKLWYRKYYSFNFSLENSDWVDFLSPYILDGVKKMGVKIKEKYCSVSPCSFVNNSDCVTGEKLNMEVAFCSRLEPDKNPLLYLEAVSELSSEYPDVKFHLLGEGSLVNEVNEYISEKNLRMNFIFHKNPPEIFSQTSIFVSLQSATNYPSQSVLEAMLCGNAIIASNTGDTKLFINQENGMLIPLNKDALAEALKKLFADRALTKKLGENARLFVINNHSIENFTEYFIGILNKSYRRVFDNNCYDD